jgi:hypothetical protein
MDRAVGGAGRGGRRWWAGWGLEAGGAGLGAGGLPVGGSDGGRKLEAFTSCAEHRVPDTRWGFVLPKFSRLDSAGPRLVPLALGTA